MVSSFSPMAKYRTQAARQRRVIALEKAFRLTGDRRKSKRMKRIQADIRKETARQLGEQLSRSASEAAAAARMFSKALVRATETMARRIQESPAAGLRRALDRSARPETAADLNEELLRQAEIRRGIDPRSASQSA